MNLMLEGEKDKKKKRKLLRASVSVDLGNYKIMSERSGLGLVEATPSEKQKNRTKKKAKKEG